MAQQTTVRLPDDSAFEAEKRLFNSGSTRPQARVHVAGWPVDRGRVAGTIACPKLDRAVELMREQVLSMPYNG